MSLVLNYVYPIYPDAEQEEKLLDWLDICTSAYNYALREIKDWCNSLLFPFTVAQSFQNISSLPIRRFRDLIGKDLSRLLERTCSQLT
ncbi:MAG: helix-turn-helix domain-containing protein [Xenococcaceae cyanobacterium]